MTQMETSGHLRRFICLALPPLAKLTLNLGKIFIISPSLIALLLGGVARNACKTSYKGSLCI